MRSAGPLSAAEYPEASDAALPGERVEWASGKHLASLSCVHVHEAENTCIFFRLL